MKFLITGGTGSFGSNFLKYLLKSPLVEKVVVLSRDELKQSVLKAEVKDERVRFFLGDVRDLPRLERAFHGIDIVIHAAALKQVPTLEYNPFEAVKTNILGSQNVLEAAINQGVRKVLLISTDKAVHPVNLYGSTKLCAEKLFINGNSYSAGKTLFSCVRYGNVLGSRGSIVESLLRNKANGKKITITDPRMTRFWISLEQSFELVMFALENMQGGEIFVPKIPSMKIVDLMEAIVPGSEKEIIGIREGEKIHEYLLTTEEARRAYDWGKYFVILPEMGEFFSPARFGQVIKEARKLPEDFCYCSQNNENWLKPEDLNQYLNNH